MKSTVLPQAESKGSTRNALVSFRIRLRQHCQFLTLVLLFKTFFEKELKKERLPPMPNHTLSRNVYLEDDIHPAGQYIMMTQTSLPVNMYDYENVM